MFKYNILCFNSLFHVSFSHYSLFLALNFDMFYLFLLFHSTSSFSHSFLMIFFLFFIHLEIFLAIFLIP